jgi:MFS family permease
MLRSIAASYREAYSGITRPVWLLSIATLVNRSGTMVLPFFALYLNEELGFTPAEAGRTLALYGLGGMAASFLGGWLCDRFDPRRVMTWSLVLTGAGFLILGHLRERWTIYLAVMALSIAGEAFRPANAAALAAASDPAKRVRSFALNRLAVNLGMTLGPAVGGFLAAYDYGWLFKADGMTCLLAAGLLQLSFREAGGLEAPRAAPLSVALSGPSPWRDGPFLALLGLMFLVATVVFQVMSTYPLSLRDLYGLSEAGIGLVLAINTFLIVLFEMVLVHSLADRDPYKVLGVGGFLFCAGFALLPLGSSFAYAAFTVAVWSVGEMLSFPISVAVVADRAAEANRGRYMGLYNLAFATAFVVAPLLGTWIYQSFGPRALWYGCGAVGVVVWIGFYALSAVNRSATGRDVTPRAA